MSYIARKGHVALLILNLASARLYTYCIRVMPANPFELWTSHIARTAGAIVSGGDRCATPDRGDPRRPRMDAADIFIRSPETRRIHLWAVRLHGTRLA